MRETMREFLWLLLLGQSQPLSTGAGRSVVQVPLRYQDLEALRPSRAASSWRGAAMKAQRDKLIIKTRFQGSTAFQLTRLGVQQALNEIPILQQLQNQAESTLWTIGMLQAISPTKTHSNYLKVKSRLQDQGGEEVFSQVFIWPYRWTNDSLIQFASDQGYALCCIFVDPKRATPMSIGEWLSIEADTELFLRKIEKSSNITDSLLVKMSRQNKYSYKQKEQLGTIWISGLEVLTMCTWKNALDPTVRKVLEDSIDQLSVYGGQVQQVLLTHNG